MSGEGANVYRVFTALAAPASSSAYKIYGSRNATCYLSVSPAGTATATVNIEVSPQAGTPTIWIPAQWLTGSALETAPGVIGLTATNAVYVASWSIPVVQIRYRVSALAGGTLDAWLQVEL